MTRSFDDIMVGLPAKRKKIIEQRGAGASLERKQKWLNGIAFTMGLGAQNCSVLSIQACC
ncbi:MAG: hypothetical protein HRT38_15490 [Alteromonadaceae bacterium]|nr:hypothetical protein [Alteromonadaceae bacterium]